MDSAPDMPPVVVVMGVAGSGKSTVGARLAQKLALPFLEGDGMHPPANRAKMASGHALDDQDRRPWLLALAAWIREATASGRGGVMACSALKHEYRDEFRRAGANVWFLHLALDAATAERRVAGRPGQFHARAAGGVPVRRPRAPAPRRTGADRGCRSYPRIHRRRGGEDPAEDPVNSSLRVVRNPPESPLPRRAGNFERVTESDRAAALRTP